MDPAVEARWHVLWREKLFFFHRLSCFFVRWQILNDVAKMNSHMLYQPCDNHLVAPLFWGEMCSPLFWRVGEPLPSLPSPSIRLRVKTSAQSCRESSVEGGAGGGGRSACDWLLMSNTERNAAEKWVLWPVTQDHWFLWRYLWTEIFSFFLLKNRVTVDFRHPWVCVSTGSWDFFTRELY